MIDDTPIGRQARVNVEPRKASLRQKPAMADRPATHPRLVDLSHPIEAGNVTYSGLPTLSIRPFLQCEASRAHCAPGVSFAIDLITLCRSGSSVHGSARRRRPGPRWIRAVRALTYEAAPEGAASLLSR